MEKYKNELEIFKRMYFKNYPTSSKDEEAAAVIQKGGEFIQEILPTIISTSRAYDTNQKALLLAEGGKMYNVLEDYNETAEKMLSKSVRMNPKNADAWHELGLCVMKRRDLEFAQSCFKIALGISKTAPILTSLAVAMRLVALEHPEPAQAEIRTKAMELIIEARRLDSAYGPANIAFATGLFYCFFSTAKVELKFLDKVIENYKKALECELSRTDPQVYINMATCLKFMEKYDEALAVLQKAVEYDPRNELETREKLASFVSYLSKFTDAIQKKGKMKAKRMQEMINELKKSSDGFRAKIIGNIGHDETIPVTIEHNQRHMEDYIKTLISHGYEQNKNFFKCRFIKNRRGDECDFVGTLSDTHIHFSTHTKVYLFECEGCTKRVVDFMELVEHRAPSTGIVCRGTVENMRQLRQDRMKTIEAHRCRNIFIVGATRDEFDEYLKYKKANEKHQSYGTPLYGEEEQQTRHQPQHRRASTPLVRTTPTPPSTLAPRDLRALPLDFPIPANFSQPPPVIPPGYFFNAPTGSQEHHQHYAPQPQENARPITPHGYPMPQNHHQNGGGWNPCANPPSARNAPATVKDNRSSSRPRRDRSQPRSYQPPVDPVQDRSRNGRATPMGTRGAPSPASSQNGNLFRNGTGSQHRGSPTDFKSKAPAKPPAQNGNASHNEHRSRSRSRATVPRSAQYRSEHQTEHARTGSSSHHESRSRAAAAAPVGASSQSKPPAPSPTSRETDSIPEAPAEPIRNISPPQPRWTRSQSRGRSEATRRSPPKGPSAPPAYTLPFGGSTPNHEPMDLEDPVPPPRPDRPRASTPLNTPVSQITRDEVATGVFHIRPQPVQDAVRMARTTIGYAGTRNRSPLREADAEQIAQVEAIKNRFAVQSRGTAKARSNSNRGAALLIETPEERQKKKDDASLEIMRKIKEKGRRLEQEKMGDSIAPNAAGTPPPTPPSVAAMLEPKEELDEDEPSTSTNVPVLRRVNSPPAQSTSYARRNDGKRHPSKSRSSRDDRDHRRDRDYDRRRGDDRRRDNHSHPYRRH